MRVGPYRLLRRLGAGGMGTVYLGLNGSGRQVAVKLVRPDLARVAEFRERLKREADSARRVARFCTAAVLDVNVTADVPYLVTEFVDGPTLAEVVRERGPLHPAELHQLAASMATALMAIHRAGIVHRDLKPSNIVLSRLGPKVIDFGIARALDTASVLSGEHPVGTPALMAPEQARGDTITSAADVFAWGGVLVYAATGRYPFGTGPAAALLYRTVNDTPTLDGFEDSLRPLVEEAMRKAPADRPTAEQLYARLLDMRVDEAELPLGPPLAEVTALVQPVAPGTPGTPGIPGTPGNPSPSPSSVETQAVPPTPVTVLSPHGSPAPSTAGRAGTDRRAGTAGRAKAHGRSQGRRSRHGWRGIALLAAILAAVIATVVLVVVDNRGAPSPTGVPEQVAARALRLQFQDRPLARRLALAAYHAAPESASTRNAVIGLFAADVDPVVAPLGSRVLSAALRPDGRLLAAGTEAGTIELWDLTDLAHPGHAGTISGVGDWVYSVAFDPGGNLLAAGVGDGAVRLWDVTDPARAGALATIAFHRDRVRSVAFAPDGGTLASGGDDGQVGLWAVTDPAHPQRRSATDGAVAGIRSLAFSPRGGLLALAGDDGSVRLWNVADPARPATSSTLRGTGRTVQSVAFSADSSTLAAGGIDGAVHTWRVDGPGSVVDLGSTPGGVGGVTSVAFSPDRAILVSASEDETVRLTDISAPADPVLLTDLRGHTKAVSAAMFVPGGRTVVSASGDGSVRLWTVDPAVLTRNACADPSNQIGSKEWYANFPNTPYASPCP
ncbi:WD40 repeat domain-containing serine/threonine protein kinase [Parafrankia soli]|uniref:WD40 repeat domain-containing serine/threonine protein kinase n=1 Tax=Parafrankia soli TaxID=2599596 RepID=UPI000E2EE7F4|nr:serine/threonine-protein kinase [Parafrankia soli]